MAVQVGSMRGTDEERAARAKAVGGTLILAGVGAYAAFAFGYVLGFSRHFSLSSAAPGAGAQLRGALIAAALKFSPLAPVTPTATFIWWLLRG